MLLRALLAFFAMPGLVAFAVPLMWLHMRGAGQVLQTPGLVLLAVGTIGLLWCVRDFYVQGRGTLAPWCPPERLVVVGLYRYTRNPMYVAVVMINLGWAVAFGVPGIYAYAAGIAVAFHLRVVFGEEPWLARVHGAQWRDYSNSVPRWL